jgi:benzoate-CoA ligase
MSTPTPEVAAPPARFNFAEHLLQANAARPAKAAFVDDAGTLSYGELAASACAGSRPACAAWACGARSACCC